MKKGIYSTEFWLSFIMALVVAVLGVFVANGLLTAENSNLIVQLSAVLLGLIVPLVIGKITTRYTHGRTTLKLQQGEVARSNKGVNSSNIGNL